MPVDFYYTGMSPPCRAVQMVAEAVGISLNLIPLDLEKKDHLGEDFLKINPQHCVPTIVDDDFVLWESRPIMSYFAEQYGKNDSLYPKDPILRAKVDRLLYFDMGTLFTSIYNFCVLDLQGKKEHLNEDFLKINPQHCVPTIVDDDFILWESRPIITYLVEQYGKNDNLYPKDPAIRGKIDQLLYFDMGTLFASVMDGLFRPVIFGGQKPQQNSVEKVYDALGFLEQFLEGHLFAVGNRITIADYVLVVTVSFIDALNLNIQKYPKVSSWFNRCTHQIPGYDKINKEPSEKIKAISKGKFRI